MGLGSLTFHTPSLGGGILSPAVVPAAIGYYFVNTALISIAMSLQLGINPIRFWLIGTKENGLVEISLFAFGFLGAVSYHESPATVLALVIPVFITYFAFSRLRRSTRAGKHKKTLRKPIKSWKSGWPCEPLSLTAPTISLPDLVGES